MAKKKENDSLGFIGFDGQVKIVKAMMEDRNEMSSYWGLVNQNLFTDEHLRDIVGIIKDFYNNNKTTPSYQLLEVIIREKQYNEIREESIFQILSMMKSEEYTYEMSKYKDIAIRFFQQQECIKIVSKMQKMLKDGGFEQDEWLGLIEDGKKVGVTEEENDGIVFTDLMDEIALGSQEEEKIPTGLQPIDELLCGGLEKGRMALCVAPTGRGKTTLSTIMASNAALAGKKVLQIVFEDTEKEIQVKHYAKLLNKYTTHITSNGLTKAEKETLMSYAPLMKNRIIKRMKNGITAWEDIENYINHLMKTRDFKPDVIFIDYFDCLKHSTDTRLKGFEAATKCCRKIEGYAGENHVAIWVFQQTNREAFTNGSDKELEATLQGSISLTQVSSFNLFMIRTQEDMANDRASFKVTKNRQGSVGSADNFHLNNGTLQVNFENNSNNIFKHNGDYELKF